MSFKRKYFRAFAILLFLLSGIPFILQADVFSLWPFSGKGSLSASGVPEGVELWTEDVSINGRNMEMQVSLIEQPLQDVLSGLKKRYRKFSALAGNSNSLLFEVPLKSGARKRFYLVAVSGVQSILLFSMELPGNFSSQKGSSFWPTELVLPPGAKPGTVMKFPKRKAIYGQFDSPFTAPEVISQVDTLLKNSRWTPVANDNNRFATGGLYLRNDGKEIMIFSIKDHDRTSGKKGCAGTLYTRKL